MEGDSSDSSVQRWVSPVLASSLVLGAVGFGLVLYRYSGSKGTKKKAAAKSSATGSFSSLYNGKPNLNSSKSASSPDSSGNANDMKGYKTNSKGQKTTYFNRELSEEEKHLIGDITPKKIDTAAMSSSSSSSSSSHLPSSSPQPILSPSLTSAGGSAWNTAGRCDRGIHIIATAHATAVPLLCSV